ncbi:MAG: DUF1273 family protein [Clostridiales bacterium]|nr:DUF1273 family protein [Clostridiales bacterium]
MIIYLNLLCNLYHPEVKLILVLPYENQTKYWKQQDIDVYNDIRLRADKVKVLAVHYYNGCMQKSRHLVDCSSACSCFLDCPFLHKIYTIVC